MLPYLQSVAPITEVTAAPAPFQRVPGANVKAVSTRLVHANVSTTLNIYAEQIKSADAAAAEALDAALLPSAAITDVS